MSCRDKRTHLKILYLPFDFFDISLHFGIIFELAFDFILDVLPACDDLFQRVLSTYFGQLHHKVIIVVAFHLWVEIFVYLLGHLYFIATFERFISFYTLSSLLHFLLVLQNWHLSWISSGVLLFGLTNYIIPFGLKCFMCNFLFWGVSVSLLAS